MRNSLVQSASVRDEALASCSASARPTASSRAPICGGTNAINFGTQLPPAQGARFDVDE
jgi:hypothetical protein